MLTFSQPVYAASDILVGHARLDGNYPVSADRTSLLTEPFTPSAGDLWHGPKVFATMEHHAMSEDEYYSTYYTD